MIYAIIGHDAPDAKEKRPGLRPSHLANLDPLVKQGKILLAGAFGDGSGSLIVVEADSIGAVWQLMASDPYVREGVFTSIEVKPLKKALP